MTPLRILVQKGHVAPREPGFEQATGTRYEQEFVTKVADALARIFEKDDRFKAIIVPGNIPDGIKVEAALFLHGDGSVNPHATGYSFGYPDYIVNREFARLIDFEFQKIPGHPTHHRDNYTGDMSGYYGFRRVETLGPEVLIEHGFLSNPGERLWLFANVEKLAVAEYVAVCRYFGFVPRDNDAIVARRKLLRKKILGWIAAGKTWAWVKTTATWREFRRLGGK